MIELNNISIASGEFRIKNASMKVATSEFAILMGRTGGGKTTILEAICGLRQVTAGQVLLDGINVTNWSPGDRGIGYVPQDLALFPNMNVREHLSFALRLRRNNTSKTKSRVAELAEVLGIKKLLDRSIVGLSGGERQRVALGRAISFHPRALVLDEPFSALDEQTRREMHELLRQVTKDLGMTTIHVTHSEEEAVALADRRFVLENGVLGELQADETREVV